MITQEASALFLRYQFQADALSARFVNSHVHLDLERRPFTARDILHRPNLRKHRNKIAKNACDRQYVLAIGNVSKNGKKSKIDKEAYKQKMNELKNIYGSSVNKVKFPDKQPQDGRRNRNSSTKIEIVSSKAQFSKDLERVGNIPTENLPDPLSSISQKTKPTISKLDLSINRSKSKQRRDSNRWTPETSRITAKRHRKHKQELTKHDIERMALIGGKRGAFTLATNYNSARDRIDYDSDNDSLTDVYPND